MKIFTLQVHYRSDSEGGYKWQGVIGHERKEVIERVWNWKWIKPVVQEGNADNGVEVCDGTMGGIY